MFDRDRKNSLPMYKDKPYAYPGSHRRGPWFRRKSTLAGLALSVFALLYWLGFFSSGSVSTPSRGRKPSGSSAKGGKVDWTARAEDVREVMRDSWAGYEKYAWGYDEYHPISKNGRQMVNNGMGWIIVDALDTLMIMNLTSELAHAREWVSTTLSYDVNHDVNVFETTIRMLGGLLSAHYLSTEFPNMAPVRDKLSDDLYLEKATDLADRLMGAYNSTSGVPYASINLHEKRGLVSHDDGGASSTAEATTLQLEMKYMAKLTGETVYWETAEHVMKVVDDNEAKDGLVPIFIYADQGTFRGQNIRLGSRGDSYYEYLIKQYLQTSLQEPIYLEMWDEALEGVQKHLITYSHPSQFTVLAERPEGIDNGLSPKMDHLVCFMPGTIALGATKGLPLFSASTKGTWTRKHDREMELAKELMKTCWGMYKATSTGLAPEIAHFHLPTKQLMMSDFPIDDQPKGPGEKEFQDPDGEWRKDFLLKPADLHNLQRPETVESLFYMWRITKDPIYREWGWEMFEAFRKYTSVGDAGYSSLNNVNQVPVTFRDNMESFWLAETLKYFYLLFGPEDVLPLDKVVFNTEAHPFPKFELGKLFKTGWQRKPRRKADVASDDKAKKESVESASTEKPHDEKKKGEEKEDERKGKKEKRD
ncbi:glycoside hydrolase family 47 protein [Myriangium duriaei CBS 260.36]|uniref:alpha-1,2-Mannosidase n=1 Tax=Myriangium duriaei CBS 260.36 TaxID=1168546 RepID=A0A9P4J7L9_9PEZI|nr:glycoside hydrolase family 47 protein [Myriangium duriaei CBS 260.36]